MFKASVGWLLWRIMLIILEMFTIHWRNRHFLTSRESQVGRWIGSGTNEVLYCRYLEGIPPKTMVYSSGIFPKLHLTKFHLTVASGKNRLHLDESPRLGKLKPKGTVGKHLRDWSMPRTNARAFVAILKCVQPENYNWVYAEKKRRGGI